MSNLEFKPESASLMSGDKLITVPTLEREEEKL